MIEKARSAALFVVIAALAASVAGCEASQVSREEMTDYLALVGACEAANRLRGQTDANIEARRQNSEVGRMAVRLAEKIEWPSASERLRGLHAQATYLARCSSAYAYGRPDGPLDKKLSDSLDAAIRNSRDEIIELEGAFGSADAIRQEAGDAVMQMLASESKTTVRDSVRVLASTRIP